MNAAKVISVDPRTKTLGEFNFNHDAIAALSRSLSNPSAKRKNPYKKLVNLLLGINSRTSMAFSQKMIVARFVAGIAFLICAYSGISPFLLTTLGVSMILGLCMRLTSFAGAISLASTLIYLPLSGGEILLTSILGIVSAVLCISGPGRISLDLFIRKDLFTAMMKEKKEEKPDPDTLDYRAYANLSK